MIVYTEKSMGIGIIFFYVADILIPCNDMGLLNEPKHLFGKALR